MLEVWPRLEVKKKSLSKREVCEVEVCAHRSVCVCLCSRCVCVCVWLLKLLSDVMESFGSDAPGGVERFSHDG